MQGVVTKFSDATWRAANVAIPPLPVLAAPTVLWAYLGGSLAQSQSMIAGAPAIVVGAGSPAFPVPGNCVSVGPTTSALPGAGYLDTNLKDDSKSFTLLFVARLNAQSGTAAPLCNNDPATSNRGIRVTIQSSPAGLNCTINGPSINRTLTVPNPTRFVLYAITYDDATFTMDIWNLTDNTTDHFVGLAFTRLFAVTTNFLIGYNVAFTGGLANPSDVAFVGKINGAVTFAQAQALGANIRATLALTGMMV